MFTLPNGSQSNKPDLVNLTTLVIQGSAGLNNWTTFPQLIQGLDYIELSACLIDDDGMNRILTWAFNTSVDSLSELLMNANNLTGIPQKIARFNLATLELNRNPINSTVLTEGSMIFNSSVKMLGLAFTGIETIEPGAFQGGIHCVKDTRKFLVTSSMF